MSTSKKKKKLTFDRTRIEHDIILDIEQSHKIIGMLDNFRQKDKKTNYKTYKKKYLDLLKSAEEGIKKLKDNLEELEKNHKKSETNKKLDEANDASNKKRLGIQDEESS